MTKTITLTGEETAVKLDKQYPYIWVQNLGESDVYMSVRPGIVPDADGVRVVPVGGGKSTGDVGQTDTLYLLGSGKVEVIPQFDASCPGFNPKRKGGDNNAEKYISGFLEFSDVTNGYTEISDISNITLPSEFTLECCCMWEAIENSSNWGRFIHLVCGSGTKDVIIATHNPIDGDIESEVGVEIKIFGEWFGERDTGGIGIEHLKKNVNYTITVVAKSEKAYFYLDGSLVGSSNISVTSDQSVRTIVMKQQSGDVTTTRYIDGKIYSARIYSRALSDDELIHNASVDKKLFGR